MSPSEKTVAYNVDSLSLHRHPSICMICNSHSTSYHKHILIIPVTVEWGTGTYRLCVCTSDREECGQGGRGEKVYYEQQMKGERKEISHTLIFIIYY